LFGAFIHRPQSGVSRLSRKVFFSLANALEGGDEEMNQLIFVVLIALCLMLTGYFGLAAWRLSGDERAEITGTILPN
jgi:hypothetical protein